MDHVFLKVGSWVDAIQSNVSKLDNKYLLSANIKINEVIIEL